MTEATASSDEQIIARRPPSHIPDSMFDRARGKPASIRPPSSSSISFADLEREDVEFRVGAKLKRKIDFDPSAPLDQVKKIGELIVKRKIPSVEDAEKIIPLLLMALDPKTYESFDFTPFSGKTDDKELWDILVAELFSLKSTETEQLTENLQRVYVREREKSKKLKTG